MGLDDRIRQEVDAAGEEIAAAFASRLKAVADQIASAAAEERSAAEARARASFADELARARDEAESTRQAAISHTRSETEQRLGAELDRVRAEADRAHAAVSGALAETEQRLGTELDRARAEIESITAHAGRLAAESDRLKAEAAQLKEEFDRWREQAAREREDAEQAKAAAREQIEQATSEKEAALKNVEAANREKETAHQELQKANQEKAAAYREKEAAARDKEAADRDRAEAAREKEAAAQERDSAGRQAAAEIERRAAEREATLAGLDRLAAAFRRIDGSSALADVLGVLADAAALETARVALFVAAPATPGAPPRFKVWRLHGFPPPPSEFDPGLMSAKELARTGLPFAPLGPSRAGVAIPIDVGGQTVAMVYADDGEAEHPSPAGWPEAIELVARHAALRIETLTAVRTAQVLGAKTAGGTGDEQSARRYAKLLVSEIKMYNEASIRQGRAERDLYDRLRSEIERARRLFEERVPAHGARQAFDEELIQTLAGGDAALLGAKPTARRHA